MASSSDLTYRRNMYIKDKNLLKEVANNLNSSIAKLDVLLENETKAYKIDDTSGSGSYLSNLREKEKTVYNNLVNSIIPSLEEKIQNLKYQIADAKEQEELAASAESES